MMTKNLLVAGVLALVLCVSACGTRAARCDGKLSPINAPAPVSKAAEQSSMDVMP